MVNNFIFNPNRVSLNGEEVSQSTDRYNFSNDASTLDHGFQPHGTYSATTYTVTFSDDGSGSSATQTVTPFQTIGFAIEEKKLSKTGFYPTYIYNESIVTKDSEIKITSNITITVIWKAVE